ncbi:MAG: hypothetical protein PVF66_04910 [Candidatus Aminicenantes bacterium]|jgi:hypothetical protein
MRVKKAGLIGLIFLFVIIPSSLAAEEKKIEEPQGFLNGHLEKSASTEGALPKLIHQQYSFLRVQEPADEFQEAIQPDSRRFFGGSARVDYYFDDGMFMAYMGVDIWPTQKIFILAQAVYDSFETYHIKLSAQGGIRLGNFSPRIGMIESKGGLGIDFHAFKDKFKFSAEAFDLSRDPDPRYRMWAGYAVLEGFQVILGIDDFAVTSWRKGFFGFEVGF